MDDSWTGNGGGRLTTRSSSMMSLTLPSSRRSSVTSPSWMGMGCRQPSINGLNSTPGKLFMERSGCSEIVNFRMQHSLYVNTPTSSGRASPNPSLSSIKSGRYKTGFSVLFRDSQSAKPRNQKRSRDSVLTSQQREFLPILFAFQSHCRGFLARRRHTQRKKEHAAVYCIQKNSLLYLKLRNDSWMRLFQALRPLINPQRLEQELHFTKTELEKFEEQLQNFRNQNENYRLEICRLKILLDERDSEPHESGYSTSSSNVPNEMCPTCRKERTADGVDETDDDFYIKYQRAKRDVDFYRHQLDMLSEEITSSRENSPNHEKEYSLTQEVDRLHSQLSAEVENSTRLTTDMQLLRSVLDDRDLHNLELEKKLDRMKEKMSRVTAEKNEAIYKQERAQKEIDQKMRVNSSLERELQETRNNLKIHIEKESALTLQLSDASDNSIYNEELQEKIDDLSRSNKELEEKLSEKEVIIEDHSEVIVDLENQRKHMEVFIAKLKQQQTRKIEEHEDEMAALRQSLNRRITELEEQLDEEMFEKDRMKREKREIERQLSDVWMEKDDTDIDMLVQKEKSLRKEMREMQNRLNATQTTLDQYQDENTELKGKLSTTENDLDALVKENKDLRNKLDQVTARLSSSSNELESRCKALSKEKSTLQSRLTTRETEYRELEQRLEKSDQRRSTDRQSFTSLKRKHEDVQVERNRLQRELTETRSQLKRIEEESREGENARIEVRLKVLETEHLQEKEELEEELAKSNEELKHLRVENDALRHAEACELAKVRRLKRQVAELRDQLEETERHAIEVERRKASLEDDLEETQSELGSHREQIIVMKSQLARSRGGSANVWNWLDGNSQNLDDGESSDEGTITDDDPRTRRTNMLLDQADMLLSDRASSVSSYSSLSRSQSVLNVGPNKPQRLQRYNSLRDVHKESL